MENREIAPKMTICNPCVKPISKLKRFNAGDSFRVKTSDAGYPEGTLLPLYGYSNTPDGINIITDGTMPKAVRDFCTYPAGEVTEIWFKVLPKRISEIPLTTAEEYLEFIPAEQNEAKIIPMYPQSREVSYTAQNVA